MNKKVASVSCALALSLAIVGCSPSQAAPAQASPAAADNAVAPSPAASRVAKIVFVGKEQACDCTRKTVDAGWAALQQALGTPAKIPVEQLQIDTQGPQVMPYRQQRPMMALPAIYFVDAKNAVVELLQGEVATEQIVAVLAK